MLTQTETSFIGVAITFAIFVNSFKCDVFIFPICPVSWEIQHSEMVYRGVWPMNVKPGEVTAQGLPMTDLKKKALTHKHTYAQKSAFSQDKAYLKEVCVGEKGRTLRRTPEIISGMQPVICSMLELRWQSVSELPQETHAVY